MTGRRRLHLRARDLRFVAVVALNLACIGAYVATQTGPADAGAGGWRRIDRAALERRIESGELSGHEALWYRPVIPPAR